VKSPTSLVKAFFLSFLGSEDPTESVARDGDLRLKNAFGSKMCWNLLMCGGILFASTEVVHRSRLDFPLHFDIGNIWQIRMGKKYASARRLPPAALLEC